MWRFGWPHGRANLGWWPTVRLGRPVRPTQIKNTNNKNERGKKVTNKQTSLKHMPYLLEIILS
jgi:hypothetical protein